MSWISVVDESDASGELKEFYDGIKGARGKLSNIMKVQSLNPSAMKNHLDLYMTIMFGRSGLKREERELIATVVSIENKCEYCTSHHAEALKNYWKDEEKVKTLVEDPTSLDLPERKRRMVDYAVKLTKSPGSVGQEDINILRKAGFSDEDILNINLTTSYFNFVNRIALGLGVEFTGEEMRGYKV